MSVRVKGGWFIDIAWIFTPMSLTTEGRRWGPAQEIARAVQGPDTRDAIVRVRKTVKSRDPELPQPWKP